MDRLSHHHEGICGGEYECQGQEFTEEGFVAHGAVPFLFAVFKPAQKENILPNLMQHKKYKYL